MAEKEQNDEEVRIPGDPDKWLRVLIEHMPQLVWRADVGGGWTWAGPQWRACTGQSLERSMGQGWLDAVHPNDREAVARAWSDARERGVFEAEYRVFDVREERYRWFQTRAAALRGQDGEVTEWLGASTDIDDLRRSREQERQLSIELQHRVRNTLAVIRSLIRRTGETSSTLEDFAMHLDGRIAAFARIQTAVTRNPSAGVDLAALVADELNASAVNEGPRLSIDGPFLALQPRAAQTFALAIHELTTNAIKYGALAVPSGRIEVTWVCRSDAENPALVFDWNEHGARAPGEPMPAGFGTDLLQRTLRYELKATVISSFAADGLRCRIVAPLTKAIVWTGSRTTMAKFDPEV